MTLTSEPAGASLVVDGRHVGRAPWSAKLAPGGVLEVRASLPGALTTTRMVKVGPEADQVVVIPLAPAEPAPTAVSVAVRVEATPWGYVSVDGRKLGLTTPAILDLRPGEHRLLVENPVEGWTDSRLVTVVPGEPQTVVFKRP